MPATLAGERVDRAVALLTGWTRREVQEETGLTCRLGVELPTVRYRLADRRRKVVRYWAMTVESQVDRPPDHEVDEWRWRGPTAQLEAWTDRLGAPDLLARARKAAEGREP